MALRWGDRILETSTTTGTGAFALAAAVTGYRRFADIPSISVSDTVYYSIFAVDASGNPSGEWETGLGTYSAANELTRTTPTASTNGGAAVDFAAGTKYVMLSQVASIQPTAFMLTLLNDADAATARTTLDIYSTGEVDAAITAGSGGGGGLYTPEECAILPIYNSTTLTTLGCTATTNAVSNDSYATTNQVTKSTRNAIQPTTGASANSLIRITSAQFFGSRGYEFKTKVGCQTALATSRVLFGLHSNWGLANDPSNAANNAGVDFLGVAADEGDTNLQIMHKAAGSAMTKIDLGASFPKATAGALYEVHIVMAAGGASATYEVTRLDSAASASGTINSNLPVISTGLVGGAFNCTGSAGGTTRFGVIAIWGKNAAQ